MKMMRKGAFASLIGLALSMLVTGMALANDTFTYRFGDFEAELPTNPQRVVVLDNRVGIEFSILAGFPIVAVGVAADAGSPLEPYLADDVVRMNDSEPNAELVLSLDPDLVVVDRGMWNWYQEDAMFNGEGFNILIVEGTGRPNWRELQQAQLEAYGRAENNAEALTRYDAVVAAAAPEIQRILNGRKMVIGGSWEDQFWLQIDTFMTSVAHDLGIDLVAGDNPDQNGNQFYSAETLAPFAEAALLFMQSSNEDYQQNPIWQRLPAAAHTIKLNWLTNFGFSIAGEALVADLLAAVKPLEA